MSASFAGSRSLDERRRRRLAAGGEGGGDSAHVNVADRPPETSSLDAAVQTIAPPSVRPHFPLRKLISPRRWKHWGLATAALCVGSLILALGADAARLEATLGPGGRRLFDLAAGRAATAYSSLLWLLSGQLAVLIWWARSRSLQDFDGRYRIWSWTSAMCLVGALSLASGAHLAWSETFLWLSSIQFWNCGPLVWMAPAAGCGAVMLRELHQEMRGCRASLAMLWLAVVGWAAAATFRLAGGFADETSARDLIHAGTAMLGHLCLFTSFLLHSRHVLYESADPARRRPKKLARRLRLPRIPLPRIRLPRIRLPKLPFPRRRPNRGPESRDDGSPRRGERQSAPASASKVESETAAAPPPQPAGEAGTSNTRSNMPERSADVPDRSQAAPTGQRAVKSEPAVQRAGTTQNLRTDEPLDQGQMKGLSKRERRQLRKQKRTAARS